MEITDYLFPGYANAAALWDQMRHTYAGEQAVKSAKLTYLPMTDGQRADYNDGVGNKSKAALQRYDDYRLRAIYPNYVADTIISMLGVMYKEKPKALQLPDALAEMQACATITGDSLEMLMRRVSENQLITGRRGLLLEPPKTGKTPKVVEYTAETILNWETRLNDNAESELVFVLLDESGYELDKFKWQYVNKYRLLAIDGAGFYYTMQLSKDDNLNELDIANPPSNAVYPALLGQKLKKIPFEFINATSTLPDISMPPLLALSNMCLAIYRGDADYRQHLYQQAQDTLFLAGFDEDEVSQIRMGAGASIITNKADAKAEFIGVNSQGLPEERTALENLHAQAMNMGIALVEQKQAESGAALQTRLSVKTASMKTIALSGARGIESLLRTAAEWCGANPDDVVIEPNLDFSGAECVAKDLLDLWSAKMQGLPISGKSVHEYMRKNDFTELDYQDEMDMIDEESANLIFPSPGISQGQ